MPLPLSPRGPPCMVCLREPTSSGASWEDNRVVSVLRGWLLALSVLLQLPRGVAGVHPAFLVRAESRHRMAGPHLLLRSSGRGPLGSFRLLAASHQILTPLQKPSCVVPGSKSRSILPPSLLRQDGLPRMMPAVGTSRERALVR